MPKVRLLRPAHVYYVYRDLKNVDGFLQDFGLTKIKSDETRIQYRGTGSGPFVYCAKSAEEDKFGGTAFAVEALEDLELASTLPGASAVTDLDAPGGGKIVTIRDPIDSAPYHFVHGQELGLGQEMAEERSFNIVSFSCDLPELCG
jgi:hypothetical protein